MSIMDPSTKTLMIPALERDFKEGALYDARSEQIVTGYSLWKVDVLMKIKVHRNDGTNYSINASDTLSEKFMGLDTSASVQLSILSGLIDLRGTTETAMQTKNTEGVFSVQVRCFFKAGYKEMDMDQLTNIRFLDVARTGNNNKATHFVTKIQYGAGAIFTFTKQFQSSKGETKVKDEIAICGTKIKSVLNGSFEGNYRNVASHSQIKCEFKCFGLSLSEALPTTFDEAIRFASNFGRMAHQSMVRHGGEALGVPCVVWLTPLVSLPGCADAPKLYYEFSPDQACQWVKFFEDCDKIEKILEKELKSPNAFISVVWNGTRVSRPPLSTEMRNEFSQRIKFVTQLRSESKIKLKEMIIHVRSGHKTIEYFNQQTSSIAERRSLHCATKWLTENIESGWWITVTDNQRLQIYMEAQFRQVLNEVV